MNAEQIRMIMSFMERVSLQGKEAPAYCICMAAMHKDLEIATAVSPAPPPPIPPSTP